MATQTAFSGTNVAIAAAPPSYHLPNDNGVAVPAGLSSWQLAIDLGGTIPAGLQCAFAVEYQRTAWTDNAGIVHPAGEWLQDVGWTGITGTVRTTGSTVHTFGSTIGAISAGGVMVEPYPTHARIRVDQAGAWTLPSITLTLQ